MKKEPGVNSGCRFITAVGGFCPLLETASTVSTMEEILSHHAISSRSSPYSASFSLDGVVLGECKHLWWIKSRGALLFLLRQTGASSWAVTNRHMSESTSVELLHESPCERSCVACFHLSVLSKMKWFLLLCHCGNQCDDDLELGRFR